MAKLTVTEAVAEAWASIDGKLDDYRCCKIDQALEDIEGRYGGYVADAEALIERVASRGYKLVPIE